MDLRGVNLTKSIDGNKIHPKLSNIQWITMFYPDNPEEEISNIVLAIKTLEKDKSKKMLITDYQFISVFLKEYDPKPKKLVLICVLRTISNIQKNTNKIQSKHS